MFRDLPANLQRQIAQAVLEQSGEEYRLVKVSEYNPEKEVFDLTVTTIMSPDSLIAVRAKSKRGRRRKDGGAK